MPCARETDSNQFLSPFSLHVPHVALFFLSIPSISSHAAHSFKTKMYVPIGEGGIGRGEEEEEDEEEKEEEDEEEKEEEDEEEDEEEEEGEGGARCLFVTAKRDFCGNGQKNCNRDLWSVSVDAYLVIFLFQTERACTGSIAMYNDLLIVTSMRNSSCAILN